MTSASSHKHFLPAAGHDWFLPLYDPLTKLMGIDKLRRSMVEQAELQPGHRVLDIGCGTGSLLVLIKRTHPQVDVVGIDPDPRALARARRKAERAAVRLELSQGFADALAFGDATFDRVFSSFMFHHLKRDEKPAALREIRRVLKPGGRFVLADFAGPEHAGHGRLHRWLHSRELLEDNSEDRVVAMMIEAGLSHPRVVERVTRFFLSAVFYQASG